MLVLSRKVGEWLVLFVGDEEIRVKVVRVKTRSREVEVGLGLEASSAVRIYRKELLTKGVGHEDEGVADGVDGAGRHG